MTKIFLRSYLKASSIVKLNKVIFDSLGVTSLRDKSFKFIDIKFKSKFFILFSLLLISDLFPLFILNWLDKFILFIIELLFLLFFKRFPEKEVFLSDCFFFIGGLLIFFLLTFVFFLIKLFFKICCFLDFYYFLYLYIHILSFH